MRRAIATLGLLALLVTAGRMAVSPATYVIVKPDMPNTRATISVNDGNSRSIAGAAGIYFARIEETEGSAIITTYFNGKGRERCVLGYFTSFEIQPRFLDGRECALL